MIEILQLWAVDLWTLMSQDFAFALIGGLIILGAQLITAGMGIWKNVGIKGEGFDWTRLVYSLIKEVGLTAILLAGVVLTYMLANLAGLSILPGFDVGDVPTAALLLAYGARVAEQAQNVWRNLIYILNPKEKQEPEIEED